jgi:uncharacterized membrane protein
LVDVIGTLCKSNGVTALLLAGLPIGVACEPARVESAVEAVDAAVVSAVVALSRLQALKEISAARAAVAILVALDINIFLESFRVIVWH